MKSKGIAYLLWFFLGLLGIHKFYLGKYLMGILYFLTMGFFGIGWFIDLFTLGGQVETYNALRMARLAVKAGTATQGPTQQVIVNVATPNVAAPAPSTPPVTEIETPATHIIEEGKA